MKIQNVSHTVTTTKTFTKTVTVPLIVIPEYDQSIRYNKEDKIFEVCYGTEPKNGDIWEQLDWAAWLEDTSSKDIHTTLLLLAELIKVTCKLK